MSFRIIEGDCRTALASLESGSVQCCVTSPPYFGLRDYGVAGQIGLEATPDAFVSELLKVFREVRRVLRDDGTLWLNLGDSYAGSGKGGNPDAGKQATNKGSQTIGVLYGTGKTAREAAVTNVTRRTHEIGCKAKDLIGIPWMVAFALRADGWYLRSDIIWHKPNPMPESVTDRPTKSHEYLFLLTKKPTYYYDSDAIAEKASTFGLETFRDKSQENYGAAYGSVTSPMSAGPRLWTQDSRNKRSVWTVSTLPYREAHFATFPPKLIEPCILAGSKKGDTVLDPFSGAGTTGLVADRLGRNYIGIELNPEYAEMSRRRITSDNPLFADEEPAA